MNVRRAIACLAIIGVGVAPAPADVATITAAADAFTASSNPDNNYGGAGGLAVSASGLPNGQFQTVIRFNTAAAKAQFDTAFGAGQWHITDVDLQLNATAPNNPIFNAQAAGSFSVTWMADDSWVEGSGTPNISSMVGITHNNLGSFLGGSDQALGTYAFDGSINGMNTYDLSLASGLSGDIYAGGLVGMHLAAADAVISYVFNSRNYPTAADRPKLIITAEAGPPVPAASTWGLIVLALVLTISGTLIVRRLSGRTVAA